jgi:NADPH-ferrihemoprotein reductase
MSVSSSSDVVILALGVVLAAVYLFRDQIFVPSKGNAIPSAATKVLDSGDTRDFVAKMKAGVSVSSLDIHIYLIIFNRKNV